MARKFNEVRKEILADPKRRSKIEQEKGAIREAVRLAEIREQRKTTQVQLASRIGTTQANVSRIERSDNPYLSTLAEYVAGLGGRLEITAVFDDDVLPVASIPTKPRAR
jgi:DNA-binding XRE family transcriptional regulator